MSGESSRAGISPTRLEAFSDGVIAIIITIMVLELKVPQDTLSSDFVELWPIFLSYALSFFYVAIYWVNHHHLINHIKRVDTKILWANMLLLFTVSFIPFSTAYMGENHFSPFPTALYVFVLWACAGAFLVLQFTMRPHFKGRVGLELFHSTAWRKNLVALALYATGTLSSLLMPALGIVCASIVAALYVVPHAWIKEHTGDEN